MEPANIYNIYTNEYINLFSKDDIVYIQTFKKGFSLEQLNKVLEQHPNIEVNDLQCLVKSLEFQSHQITEKIGKLKKRILIDVSSDGMLATVIFNLTKEELAMGNRANLVKEIVLIIKEKGIAYGIQRDILSNELLSGVKYTIAEGLPAKDGSDSIINMFELKEAKPEAVENGKIDYYNLSLITTVAANTWLGERIEATDGVEGRTVKGEVITPVKGISFPLHYDKKMVYEVSENSKTILYSKEYGAVYYLGKDISLMNPLVINGDVGFKTGNILFDGFVIIQGTISDGFYVEATNDIEVNGDLGLGNIKGIVSKKGSIYIKGGILSKGDTKLEAEKNVYTKFIENVWVKCGGTAHIGFYSSNSNINAKEVIIDSMNGKLMGGSIKAETRVVSPIIGSEIGKRTIIEVTGFNKEAIKCETDLLNEKIEELKKENEQVKQKISSYSSQLNLTDIQTRILDNCKVRVLKIIDELKELDERKKHFDIYKNTRGDGEVRVTKKIYPNTSIAIKKSSIEISSAMLSPSYISQNGKLIKL